MSRLGISLIKKREVKMMINECCFLQRHRCTIGGNHLTTNLLMNRGGQWLVSHVLAILNRGEESLVHAKTCMDITMKESLEGFDLAYAYESKARAFGAIGDSEKMNKCFINAKSAGEKIDGDKDRKLFFNDLYKDPWFECTVE